MDILQKGITKKHEKELPFARIQIYYTLYRIRDGGGTGIRDGGGTFCKSV